VNAHPVEPTPDPEPPKKQHAHIDLMPSYFRYDSTGRLLLWVVPGFTQYYGSMN